MSKTKKEKENIKDRWEIYKVDHPVLLFILKPVGKFIGFICTMAAIYFTVTQGISANLGNSIASASLNLQRLQLEKPFFIYTYSAEVGGIIIKHNENINIKETVWIFPTSSTIEKYDFSDGEVTLVTSTPANLRLFSKYDATLTLNEFYRANQEELFSFSEINNQPNTARAKMYSYMIDGDNSAFGYLRCEIFPAIQDNTQPKEPSGVLVGVSNTYERLDGKIGHTYDILLIRETRKKVPEINIYYRNVTEQVLRTQMTIYFNKFYGAVKRSSFDENFTYIDSQGNCTRTGWEYTLVK